MKKSLLSLVVVLLPALFFALPAQAQATRTWVSGVGDDANPCSRTAPCKTFAGAISKTATGGEISALDPGGFGAVTITKSITINGDGTLAGILAAGTNGITVNATGATVVLRGLSLNGAGTGINGVNYLAANLLIIDNCSISGFTTSGVDAHLSGSGQLLINNTTITGGTNGVLTSLGTVNASLDHVSIRGTAQAVYAQVGNVTVSNSVLSQNSAYALHAESGAGLNVDSSVVTGNAIAVQADTGSTIRMVNSDFFDNQTGFACGTGTLASAGNNRKAHNVGGSVPVCSPTVAVTLQ